MPGAQHQRARMLGLGELLKRSRRGGARDRAQLDLEGCVRGERVRRLRETFEDLGAACVQFLVARDPVWPVGAREDESLSHRGRKRGAQRQRIVCLRTAVVPDDYRARV
jgi:hypothetical protein